MTEITVPDMNDSFSLMKIDNKNYNLRFTYNEKYDYWSFGLYDNNKNPIVAMTKIIPSFPLFYYYRKTNTPDGHFACITEKAAIGRNDFIDGNARFVYIPSSELE